MDVTEQDKAVFREAFYRNTGDETDDPVEIGLKAVFAAKAPSFVRLDQDRMINTADISSVFWDRRFYMNGSESTLVVTMCDGTTHRLKNDAWTDAFAVAEKIETAIGGVL